MKRDPIRKPRVLFFLLALLVLGAVVLVATPAGHGARESQSAGVLRGEGQFDDWSNEHPGDRHLIRTADLPKPYASSSTANRSKVVHRPERAWPQAPAGFKVEQVATGLENARQVVTAPNGDLFLSESTAGRVRVLRGLSKEGKIEANYVFASGLTMPYGIAFYPPGPTPEYVYVGNTNSVVRFPYKNGDLEARGPVEAIIPDLPGGGGFGGGHWTRNLTFSKDGKKLYVAVGSHSNVSDDADEKRRADVLEFNPDGSGERVYAWGIRNPAGLTTDPMTGELWVAVNERDELGDDLPPDYVTHVIDGGFYGWPWFYLGGNQDPRHEGKNPELKDKVLVPDVLLQSHSAPLSIVFYNATQFPREYRGGAFVTSHGSWNRAKFTGYKVIYIPMSNGKATGEYVDFITGLVSDDGNVWGRPVGVTVARDGALVITDDASNSVWRVTFSEEKRGSASASR